MTDDKQKPQPVAKPAPKAQPFKGPPSNKADHAAFKRIDKTAIKRMRKK